MTQYDKNRKYHVFGDDRTRHSFTAEDDMHALVTAFIMGYENTKVWSSNVCVGVTPRFVNKSQWEDEYLDKIQKELP